MALLDAKEYDPGPAKRRWRLVGAAVLLLVVGFIAWRIFRYWPEEHAVSKLFEALERKDFETAYAVWNADPDWKQHPQQYNQYTLAQFTLDWGPAGEYGAITSHKIDCAAEPDSKGFRPATGVIVVVIINGQTKEASLWVEKKSKTITTSPFDVQCHPPG